jgi:hypothetical protein
MLRVTTMEILKLTYWDPARDMLSVLKVIFAYSIAKSSFIFAKNRYGIAVLWYRNRNLGTATFCRSGTGIVI